MNIQAILNLPEPMSDSRESSPADSLAIDSNSPPRSAPKMDKMPKDGFLSIKNEPRRNIRYPPYETHQDPSIGPELERFQVRPDPSMGKFAEYPRYIPYTSAKRALQEKTGLKGFNVFQYEFSIQNESSKQARKHLVLWDYQVGLVRITPFFKALNYSKTTPKRVLDLNDGLSELTVSITGGSLAAQGYWMPFECAKALARTFCYSIRHVLAPIFGCDFVNTCVPDDNPAFGSFKIDPDIIRACAEDMETWHLLARSDTPQSGLGSPVMASNKEQPAASAPPTPLLQHSVRPRVRAHRKTLSEYGALSGMDKYEAASSRTTSPQVSPKTVLDGNEWRIQKDTARLETLGIGLPVQPKPMLRNPFSVLTRSYESNKEEPLNQTMETSGGLRRKPDNKTLRAAEDLESSPLVPDNLDARDYEATYILLQLSKADRTSQPASTTDDANSAPPPPLETAATFLSTTTETLASGQTTSGPKSLKKKRGVADAFAELVEAKGDGKKPARRASFG